MPQCPRCKSDMPLLSKICPVCGYVAEENGENLSAEEQLNSLEKLVLQIKGLPEPTFLTATRDLLGIIIFVLTLFFSLMAYFSGAVIFKTISGIFSIVLTYFVGKLVASWFKPSVKDEYKRLKNEYEYAEQIVRRSFGKSPEVARHIDELNNEVVGIITEREATRSRIWKTWGVIAVVFVLVATGSLWGAKSVADQAIEEAEYGLYQPKVDRYVGSSSNDEYIGGDVRLALIQEMVQAGDLDKAEKFCLNYAIGRAGDLDCAKAVVNGYVAKGEYQASYAFVAKIASMRYKSDLKKLKDMVKSYGTVQ